jgi:2-polyprenyl-3-methyl-5-hydroxy-6-metoxy-1,4-benzoquinol methylase
VKTYKIKAGYKSKTNNVTVDAVRDVVYWTPDKIAMSRRYQRSVYQWVARLVKEKKLASVLDVGCGPATKLVEIVGKTGIRIVGVDQPAVIEWCKKQYPGITFLADDFEHPVATPLQSFDMVICADVIEHMDDPDALLSYILAVLAPGGMVVLSTPERDILRGVDNMETPNRDHVREWNESELRQYLESSGFRILETKLFENLSVHLGGAYFEQKRRLGRRTKHCLAVCAVRA